MDLRWWRTPKMSAANECTVQRAIPRIDREVVVDRVKANDFTSHAGTPEVQESGWHGILLNAPRRILVTPRPPDPLFGDHAPIAVVWGYCLLPNLPGERDDEHRTGITLVAVDTTQKRVFSGRVTRPPQYGSIHVSPHPPAAFTPTPGSSSGGAFNPDLITVCGIPLTDADYELFALYGTWRSNVIDVQVRFALGS